MNIAKALPIVALIAGAAFSHADFDYEVSNIGLMQAKEVQKDMGISEAQRAKLNKHADWLNAQNKKLNSMAEKFAAKKKQPPAVLQLESIQILKEMKRRVMGELSKQQVVRLRELTIQQAGYLALMDPSVAQKIGLNESKVGQIRSHFEQNNKDLNEAQKAAFDPLAKKYQNADPKAIESDPKKKAEYEKDVQAAQAKVGPKMEALQKDWNSFVEKLLTSQQLSAFKALQGKTFKG